MGGPLDNAGHHSYEQVVIDHDIWEMAQRLTREIVVDDETLAYDLIAQVGPGGSFLGQSHTRRHIQAGEHYYGGSFNHTGRAGEEYTMLARAHERVEEILARPFEYGAPPAACDGSRTTCGTMPSRKAWRRRNGRSDAGHGGRTRAGAGRQGRRGVRRRPASIRRSWPTSSGRPASCSVSSSRSTRAIRRATRRRWRSSWRRGFADMGSRARSSASRRASELRASPGGQAARADAAPAGA